MKLLYKITIVVLTGAILTIAIVSLFIFTATKSTIETDIKERQNELGQQVIDNVDRLLFNYYVGIQNIAAEEDIEQSLGGELTDKQVMERRIKELPFLSGPWDQLQIVNSAGVVVASSTEQLEGAIALQDDPNDVAALKEALVGHVYYSDFVISSDTGRPTVVFSAPIRDQDKPSQPIVGAVLGEIAFPVIDELLSSVKQAGQMQLYTSNGTLIAVSNTQTNTMKLFTKNQAITKALAASSTTSSLGGSANNFINTPGQLNTIATSRGYLDYRGNSWVLLVTAPTNVVFALATKTASDIILFVFPIGLLTSLLILILLNRLITRPIESFTKITKLIAKGDMTKRVDIKSKDEIGELATSFNIMATNLQGLYTGMDEKIKEKTLELSNKVTELEKSKSSILELVHDVEEQKKKVEGVVVERTQQLSAESARLRASINSIPFGFIVADPNNRIVLKNKVITEMFKLDDAKEIFLEDLANIVGRDFDLKAEVELCVKGKAICEIKEIIFDKKILKGIVAPIISPVPDAPDIGYVLLLEDVTEAIAVERSRDEFFSIASHELRTPLTAIRGNSQMLMDDYKDKMTDKDMSEMVADIHESSVRLIDIVNDFLEVSRLEQGRIEIKKENFDMSDIITKVVKDMSEIPTGKDVVITYIPNSAPLPQVFSDKARVEQILFNLLGNSMKFTKKGSITIKTEQIENFIKISVTDTGLGISEQNQLLLFRKFQQAGEQVLARDVTRGTGLGLYICHLIISKLGGTIDLEKSVLGEGSTFTFTLPVVS